MTPSFSGNLSANYTTPLFGGRAFASATLSHTSSYYVSGGNRLKMPAYSLLNGSIGWRADGGAEIRLWAKNLTNENYFQYRIEQSLVGDGQVQAPPRTYGVTLSTAFRSEEHTSELQSLMRISYAVFCLKKKKNNKPKKKHN